MKITTIYERILAAMDNYVDKDRSIYSDRGDGKAQPMTVAFASPGSTDIKQLPVVLPNAALLKKGEDFTNIKFNPMAESYMSRNQSEVQKRLVHDASASVMIRLVQIFTALLYTAVDKDAHEDLDPILFRILSGIKPPKDTKAAERITKYGLNLMSKHKGIKGPNALCRYQQKVNVKVDDKIFIRATTLIMPFLQKLTGEKPYGVNPPNQLSSKIIKTIAEGLMNELDVVSTWNGREAPYFMSLLEAHNEVVTRLNVIGKALNVDLGKNFVPGFFDEKIEKELPKLFEKELNIRFSGNEGTAAEEVVEEPSAAPVKTTPPQPKTPALVPETTKVANPVPAQNNTPAPQQTEEHVSLKPIDLEKRPMAIHSRKEVNPADAAAPSYQSGFSGKQSATVNTPAPTTVAQPQEQPQQAGGLVIEQQAPAANTGGLVIEETKVHLHDARNHPLYRRNGQPYYVSQSEANQANQMKLLQATDPTTGSLKFDGNGAPVLRKAEVVNPTQPGMTGGLVPANQFYGGHQQVAQPNPNSTSSFYQTMDQQRPNNFGHSTALATGVPMNTYQQPVQPTIILQDQYRNQVQAQFDANGNAMGVYYTSQGQQVTHFSQIAHLVQAQQPQTGFVPQNTNQPVSGFNFGTSNNAHV